MATDNGGMTIRERAKKGIPSYGITIDIPNPDIVEMAYAVGYNFVRIDREHILWNNSDLKAMFDRARTVGIPCQIRVSTIDDINCFLSLGASAIMVPHIETKDQANAAINMVKYAPVGERGMTGGVRSVRFGQISRDEYIASANEKIDLIVQIESKKGISNIDEILSLEGIDMVATGKADLSQSFGVPGQKSHPDVLNAEAFIVRKTLEYGKVPTLVAENKKRADELKEMGVFSYLTGHDESILSKALKKNLSNYFEN